MSDHFEAGKDCPTIKKATRAFSEAFLADALPCLQLASRGCGYALAVHGSLARDIDLIAVPWTASPDTAKLLVERLCGALSALVGRAVYRREEDWAVKPHGRRAVTIILPGICPEIDLSIMPITEAQKDPASVLEDHSAPAGFDVKQHIKLKGKTQ
jgi:hypothetical protein